MVPKPQGGDPPVRPAADGPPDPTPPPVPSLPAGKGTAFLNSKGWNKQNLGYTSLARFLNGVTNNANWTTFKTKAQNTNLAKWKTTPATNIEYTSWYTNIVKGTQPPPAKNAEILAFMKNKLSINNANHGIYSLLNTLKKAPAGAGGFKFVSTLNKSQEPELFRAIAAATNYKELAAAINAMIIVQYALVKAGVPKAVRPAIRARFYGQIMRQNYNKVLKAVAINQAATARALTTSMNKTALNAALNAILAPGGNNNNSVNNRRPHEHFCIHSQRMAFVGSVCAQQTRH